ncbi:unnamed protein product [Lactuca virosa]|uniref:Uncharacterized protein n=1 Tax=Lactuca virosa TaxID=75947 RepID=A0AAU9NN93_9ASTR|nr:unnamed protein product [Lactuca virosa]
MYRRITCREKPEEIGMFVADSKLKIERSGVLQISDSLTTYSINTFQLPIPQIVNIGVSLPSLSPFPFYQDVYEWEILSLNFSLPIENTDNSTEDL